MRSYVLTLAAVTVITCTACGGDDTRSTTTLRSEAHDSAGVTIVDNERPADDSRMDWVISGSPLVSIGTLDGDENYQLFRVNQGTRLSDGRLALANSGTSQIRFYDAVGTFLDAWGGEGEGPGEFTGLANLAEWPGDSLMAWDFRQRRLTLFDSEGNTGRTILIGDTEDLRFAQYQGLFPDGSILVMAAAAFSAGEDVASGLNRPDRPFARVDAEGASLGSLGSHRGQERVMRITETSVSVMGHPFGRSSLTAVWGGLALISPNDTYELRTFGLDGVLRRIVRRDHTVVPMTQQDLDAEIEVRLEGLDDERRSRMADNYEGMPLLESFPAYSSVISDALGYLWVREFEVTGAKHRVWTVFNPDGAVQGFVETPLDLQIWEIGEDYLLGRTTDEFDVEYVQMWGLMRSTSPNNSGETD